MRRLYTLLFLTALVVNVFAGITGDGYYRVRNYQTKRYIYVTDNTGSINVAATTAEMGAVQLWKGDDKAAADPASVLYIKKVGTSADGTNVYDIQAQGTGVQQIIGYSVQLYETKDGFYKVYAKGFYLCDNETSSSKDGFLGTDRAGDYRLWEVLPIDDDSQYLGINTTLTHDGVNYAPYYVDFGLNLSNDMNAYYVSDIREFGVIVDKIAGSVIPAKVPMFIECAKTTAAENHVKVSYNVSTPSYASDNKLKGVFFNNDERPKSKDARTANDKKTMRVLGVTSDGNLGYITSSEKYMPANQSYLSVPEGTAQELRVFFSLEDYYEYASQFGEEPDIVIATSTEVTAPEIYDLTGRRMNMDVNSLPKGIYIINHRKVVVR